MSNTHEKSGAETTARPAPVTGVEPEHEAWINLEQVEQLTQRRARCRRLALCDESGHFTTGFHQGDLAHFFYEFDILERITVPSGGIELLDAAGQVVFGKNSYQYSLELPAIIGPGVRLRFHQTLRLSLAIGEYQIRLGLASTDEEAYHAYRAHRLRHDEFGSCTREECRVLRAALVRVIPRDDGQLTHHGLTDLPGECSFGILTAEPRRPEVPPHAESAPTIFHVTHWKAGSQWLQRILAQCFGDRAVRPLSGNTQFLHWPLQPGKVYPTVYVTYHEFHAAIRPPGARHFVVVRDLRDTLISAYFSARYSHALTDGSLARWRLELTRMDLEDGLIYLMDEWLAACARIQLSWAETGERLIRFEDLLERDVEILSEVLIDDFGLNLDRGLLGNVIAQNRFQALSGGRQRGVEDRESHFRKGVAGDWREYFSERVKRSFKSRYGGHLIAAGYERDLDW